MRSGGDTKEDRDKKLFVGGLNPKTDENSLREYYSQWGEIIDVVVMKDPRTQKSRGFGFVTFKESTAVDAAQSSRPHNIDGKDVDSKRAMPRDETGPEAHATVTKIFVGGLPKEVTNDELNAYFSHFGKVSEAQVVIKKDTNVPRGFAFVTFEDHDSVDKVILNKPHQLRDRKIDVRKALSREELQKVRSKTQPGTYNQGWTNGTDIVLSVTNRAGMEAIIRPTACKVMHIMELDMVSLCLYLNTLIGFGYENPVVQAGWSGQTEGGFGSYQQQDYAGGPIRSGAQYTRPAPYQGNTWQQR
ncbi:unnamed protein product [Protopolystoma xenopodis]|uniref:RRM domain-containing protein n=1 Tax=Protopolystoma xenopodis TaxID=117903 RepID=A0A3S5BFX5_9PLAT|nr:unnamed protein product [Protopolystoma xenopodis]